MTKRLLFTSGQIEQQIGLKACGYTYIHPRDFLELTLRESGTTIDRWIEEEKATYRKRWGVEMSLDQWNKLIRARKIIHMPWLEVTMEDGGSRIKGEIRGHEGRHRAASLLEAGGTAMQVAIQLKDKDGYSVYYEQPYAEKPYLKRFMGVNDVPSLLIGQFNHFNTARFNSKEFKGFYAKSETEYKSGLTLRVKEEAGKVVLPLQDPEVGELLFSRQDARTWQLVQIKKITGYVIDVKYGDGTPYRLNYKRYRDHLVRADVKKLDTKDYTLADVKRLAKSEVVEEFDPEWYEAIHEDEAGKMKYLKDRYEHYNRTLFQGKLGHAMKAPHFGWLKKGMDVDKFNLGLYEVKYSAETIYVHKDFMQPDQQDKFDTTLKHEMCHQYCYQVLKLHNEGHGPIWQKVMVSIGETPDVYGKMGKDVRVPTEIQKDRGDLEPPEPSAKFPKMSAAELDKAKAGRPVLVWLDHEDRWEYATLGWRQKNEKRGKVMWVGFLSDKYNEAPLTYNGTYIADEAIFKSDKKPESMPRLVKFAIRKAEKR